MRAALATLVLAACTPDARPQPPVICHNGNCAHATDPFADDTLAALDDSLRLEYRGHPALDGVEIDTVWDPAHARCVFAHDLEGNPDPAMAAAERVAAHLAQPGDIAWNGDQFFVKIELKPTDVVIAEHIDCVFDIADTIIAAARTHHREVTIGFDSESIAILRTLAQSPRWPGKEPELGISLRLLSSVLAPGLSPADLASLTGGGGAGIDLLGFHATRTPTAVVDQYAAMGVDLMLWMLDAAPETLRAIKQLEPAYVVTSEALLLRRWVEK